MLSCNMQIFFPSAVFSFTSVNLLTVSALDEEGGLQVKKARKDANGLAFLMYGIFIRIVAGNHIH